MLHITERTITPPGGYYYYDPDLEIRFKAGTLDSLIQKVTRGRKINNLLVNAHLARLIEHTLCTLIPECLTSEDNSGVPSLTAESDGTVLLATPPVSRTRSRITESEALRCTVSLLRRNPPLLSWAEAALRTHACHGCVFNVQEPCCYSCRVGSVFSPYTGKVPAVTFNSMGVCAADATFTKAVIRVSDPDRFQAFSDTPYPDVCWKLKPKEQDDE